MDPATAAAAAAASREPLLPQSTAAPDTFARCVFNLSKVIIGAGMMAIPHAYFAIGSCVGTLMLLLVAVLTYATLVILLRGSAATGASTYSQLARMCGVPVMKVLQMAVVLFCFGFGVVYLVIIRDILLGTPPDCNGLLCELFGLPTTSVLSDGRVVLIALALLVCSPLLLLRSMDRLALLNVVGVGAIGMLSVTALGLAAKGLIDGTAHPIPLWPQWEQLGHTPAERLQALTAVLPVMIACYVAHQSLHPLVPLLQPYSDARMRAVIAAALSIAFLAFSSLSVGAGLAFGPTLEVNVLTNFSVAGLQPLTGLLLARTLSWAIRGGYLISLLASLLLYMHPLRACLAEVLWPDKTLAQAAAAGSVGQAGSGWIRGLLNRLQGSGSGSSKQATEGAQPGQGQQRPIRGSVFAAPAAQAAAAAPLRPSAEAASRVSSGAGSASVSVAGSASLSANDRRLRTFDSFDDAISSSPAASQQQPEPSTGSSRHSSASGAAASTGLTQSHMHGSVQIHVTDARGLLADEGGSVGGSGGGRHEQQQGVVSSSSWQQQEQRWYHVLTYSLLAGMVLVALAVPNIWIALSAIGDLASTLQAFVVPGLIGIALERKSRRRLGSSGSSSGSSSTVYARLRHTCSGYGVGASATLLGLALFANGVYQRL